MHGLIATTVMLVHGAWMSADAWEPWCARLEARGYACMAPAWPHLTGEPAKVRAAPPEALSILGLDEIVAHYATLIRRMGDPPVLIGHSFGGLVVQRLLDEGLGLAGVALEPAPIHGVSARGSAIKASLPVVSRTRAGQRVHDIPLERWVWAFGERISEAERERAYDRYVVPAPGRPFVQVLWAGFHRKTRVDTAKPDRAPLMLVAGTEDRVIPEGMVRAAWRRYQHKDSRSRVVLQTFDRTHGIVFEPGWEEVLDLAMSWVEIETGVRPAR